MGLDVTAWSKCRFVHGAAEQNDACFDDLGHISATITSPGFVRQFEGLTEGCYLSDGESFGFAGGSYSGYNRWRSELCRLALGVEDKEVWHDPERFRGRPFVELINFTDCDGTIGPAVSAKLLADFEDNEGLAVQGDNYFRFKFGEWLRAFRLASDGGLVSFH